MTTVSANVHVLKLKMFLVENLFSTVVVRKYAVEQLVPSANLGILARRTTCATATIHVITLILTTIHVAQRFTTGVMNFAASQALIVKIRSSMFVTITFAFARYHVQNPKTYLVARRSLMDAVYTVMELVACVTKAKLA